MYGIYANIGGILMGSMLPYIAYMDPMGMSIFTHCDFELQMISSKMPWNRFGEGSDQFKAVNKLDAV